MPAFQVEYEARSIRTYASNAMTMAKLVFESLEPRRLLAGWQSPLIRFDVDESGLVTARDALLVINDVATKGARPLQTIPAGGADEPNWYVDVSGDGWVAPLDALQVLNAMQRNRHSLSLAIHPTYNTDLNENGVVLQRHVELTGQTSPDSLIVIQTSAVDELLGEVPGEALSFEVRANEDGQFSLEQSLFVGRNRLTIDVTDEIGRQHSTTRELVVGDVIVDWNAALLNVVRDGTTASNDPNPDQIVTSRPPEVARSLALVHVAVFDAINLIEGGYQSYISLETAISSERISAASTVAAAATAAHDVAMAIYPGPREREVWESTLAEALATVPAGEARQAGIEIGREVAAAVLESRQHDGSDGTHDYVPGELPGQWNRTAPGFLPPMLPHWGAVRSLAVDDVTRFRPGPPPALVSPAYARAVDEVMLLGRVDSDLRTEEQTEIALFWADGGGTATPPGHWNRIAITASLAAGESMLERARSLALLNLAMADAGIASWDTKFHYDLWRPIEAIRGADTDGNSATSPDTEWLPLIVTPPFPTYTSGHSSFSGAAAEVLEKLYGNGFQFASSEDARTGLGQASPTVVVREFDGFWDAADEAGMSRIYGGIHYLFDSTAGLAAGQAIGAYVFHHLLPPSP